MTALGNNLRVFRQARGLTLREVACAVGMDHGNLSKIERGERNCPDEAKVALAQYFGVPVSRLFFQELVVTETTQGVAS